MCHSNSDDKVYMARDGFTKGRTGAGQWWAAATGSPGRFCVLPVVEPSVLLTRAAAGATGLKMALVVPEGGAKAGAAENFKGGDTKEGRRGRRWRLAETALVGAGVKIV